MYAPAYRAGFITDFLGFVEHLREDESHWILHSFSMPTFQPLYHLFMAVSIRCFGASPLPYFFIYIFLHTWVAWQVLDLARSIFPGRVWMHWLSVLCFLSSPYAVEPVTWKVCVHYLISTACICWGMRMLIHPQRNSLWIFLLLYLIGLCFLEYSWVFPAIIVVWYYLLRTIHPNYKNLLSTGKFYSTYVIPIIGIFSIFLIVQRLVLGKWIGHYGAETHFNFQPLMLTSHLWQYIMKIGLILRFWDEPLKLHIVACITQLFKSSTLGIICTIITVLIFSIIFYQSFVRRTITGFLFLLLLLGLAPILSLYVYWLQYSENDRLIYLAWVFWSFIFTFFIFKLPGYLRILVASTYLIFGFSNQIRLIHCWKNAESVLTSLTNRFIFHDAKEILVLNVPTNYQGIHLFASRTGGAVQDVLTNYRGRKFSGKIYEVAEYNMTSNENGVLVEQLSPQDLKVTLKNLGSWWWYRGFGAKDLATQDYTIRYDHKNLTYYLHWKQPFPEDMVILTQQDMQWVPVRLKNEKREPETGSRL